ncbi:hypothetical protein [Modestobacter sp. SYSU DS0875]
MAAAGGLFALLSVVAGVVGWTPALRALAALVGLALLNGGLVALAVPRTGPVVRLVISAVLGLATAGIAVWLSGVVDWFAFRWLVVALPVVAWFHPAARRGWSPVQPRERRLGWVLRVGPSAWGVAIAWVLGSRALAGYYGPATGDGPLRQFYVDIPWHIALTSEALDRAPAVYPWIPDVPIGYSWLFFGTLGLLGNVTGATAAELVLVVGPGLLALVVPVALAACAWVVSRSRLAAVLAPVLFTVARGPVFSGTEAFQLTPQWVLVNRDSTNALVLAVLVVLVVMLRDAAAPDRRRRSAATLLILLVMTFAAAGGRGGAVLPLLGAIGLAWLASLRVPSRRALTSAAFAVMVVGVVAATLGVTRSSGSFGVDPLQLFPPVRFLSPTAILVAVSASLAVLIAMTACTALIGRVLPASRFAVPVLVGAALAGILGMAVFGHPAYSQRYFFHAGWPALVVGLAVLAAVAVRFLGPLVVVAFLVAAAAVQAVVQPPTWLPPTPWLERVALAAGATAVTVGVVALVLARRNGWARTVLLVLPVLVLAMQPWGLPRSVYPAAFPVAAPTSGSLSDGQLAVLTELRERSDPDDLVATNKHCIGGRVADGTCDARWFAVAAFAERRVFVEGWSYDYTWTSAGNDNREPYWDPELLRANDGFIAAPNPQDCEVLRGEGVEWLYVDHREAWSPALAEYADLVAGADDASLYRLRPGCR